MKWFDNHISYLKRVRASDRDKYNAILLMYGLYFGLLLFWFCLEVYNGLQFGWQVLP